jgi:protoporphyrinogen oxidase
LKDEGKILVIGGGPTGLGAAWGLQEAGCTAWELFERENHLGGLASSHVDENGFTWDLGGHVVFSHYDYVRRVFDSLAAEEWVEHVREAWIWMRHRFIPYPLQNNIRHLPPDELLECLDGLLEVQGCPASAPATLADWMRQTFGAGLTRVFLDPYNRKVWATDPAALSAQWVGERVATVDLRRVLRNVIEGRDDLGWGPNARFQFPLHGGTGGLWNAVARRLPADRIHLGREVVGIDSEARTVHLSDGGSAHYDWLITTMPLDVLLSRMEDGGRAHGAGASRSLRYSSAHIIGVGLEGRVPEPLATKCWMYFPEPEMPFYRVTVFSNYSPHNVPKSGCQWSLLAEVSEPAEGAGRRGNRDVAPGTAEPPVDGRRTPDEIVGRTVEGLRTAGLIPPGAALRTLWHRRLEHAYPTPFLGRDAVLRTIEGRLYSQRILSRGRFGAWKYEVGNMDHSFMQGVEAVHHILRHTPELTLTSPDLVNSRPPPRGK